MTHAPSEKASTLKGKHLFPRSSISFFSGYIPFHKATKQLYKELSSLNVYQFPLRYADRTFNPFMPSELLYLNSLDKFISYIGVSDKLLLLLLPMRLKKSNRDIVNASIRPSVQPSVRYAVS